MVIIHFCGHLDTCHHPHIFIGRAERFLIFLLENRKGLLSWSLSWDKGTDQGSLCLSCCQMLRAEMPVQDQSDFLLLLEFTTKSSQPGQFSVTYAVTARFSLKKVVAHEVCICFSSCVGKSINYSRGTGRQESVTS